MIILFIIIKFVIVIKFEKKTEFTFRTLPLNVVETYLSHIFRSCDTLGD